MKSNVMNINLIIIYRMENDMFNTTLSYLNFNEFWLHFNLTKMVMYLHFSQNIFKWKKHTSQSY